MKWRGYEWKYCQFDIRWLQGRKKHIDFLGWVPTLIKPNLIKSKSHKTITHKKIPSLINVVYINLWVMLKNLWEIVKNLWLMLPLKYFLLGIALPPWNIKDCNTPLPNKSSNVAKNERNYYFTCLLTVSVSIHISLKLLITKKLLEKILLLTGHSIALR